ncbi:MAG: hypothetical protein ABSC19_09430 [Syntrophorhabdales bacterium]
MAKKKIRDEIKKPDMLQSTVDDAVAWVKENRGTCIVAGILVVLIALSGWGYGAYRADRDERAQYTLYQGIRAFQEYTVNPKGDGLSKAEASFRKVTETGSGGLRDVAKLYLARIGVRKGMKEEARRLYGEIDRRPANNAVKILSESGLKELDSKQ